MYVFQAYSRRVFCIESRAEWEDMGTEEGTKVTRQAWGSRGRTDDQTQPGKQRKYQREQLKYMMCMNIVFCQFGNSVLNGNIVMCGCLEHSFWFGC